MRPHSPPAAFPGKEQEHRDSRRPPSLGAAGLAGVTSLLVEVAPNLARHAVLGFPT